MISLLKNMNSCRCWHTNATRLICSMQILCLPTQKKCFFLRIYLAEKKENSISDYFDVRDQAEKWVKFPQVVVIFSPTICLYFIFFYFSVESFPVNFENPGGFAFVPMLSPQDSPDIIFFHVFQRFIMVPC